VYNFSNTYVDNQKIHGRPGAVPIKKWMVTMSDERTERVKTRIKNISPDDLTIRFGFECDLCRILYKTMPANINDSLYNTKKEGYAVEYEQAVADFASTLTKCDKCGRLVCEQCIVSDERGDLCSACANDRIVEK